MQSFFYALFSNFNQKKSKQLSNPKTHSIEIIVEKEHLDELEHVNNVIYLNFIQEAAIAHWNAIAPKDTVEDTRWVVRKHEIEYLKPALLDDKLIIKTWVEEFTAVTSLRKYEIKRDNDLIATASTLWIALSFDTMKPKRLDKSIASLFFE